MYCSKCGTELANEALFCTNCGEKTKANSNERIVKRSDPESLNIQNVHTTELKEYLSHAKTLEVNRYTLNTTINRLQDKINSLGIKNNFSKPTSQKGDFLYAFLKMLIIGIFMSLVVGLVISGLYDDTWYLEPVLVVGIAWVTLPLSIIVGFISVSFKTAKRDKEFENVMAEDNARVEKEKLQIAELEKQQADLQNEIADIELLLDKLYSSNIVYPKYRELVPIVTMWEYIDSGRCMELFGANGAYNLYESESRQDIIISNLSQAISMLAQIRDNQYALYEAIQESNEIAERVYMQSESLLSANQEIAKNSALTAYNAKIAAENSTISAYIDFCKF